FGITCMTVNLTAITNAFYATMPTNEALFGELQENPAQKLDERFKFAEANVRPRMRMTTLYYLANMSQGVVVGPTNKTEFMIGYFTKYGDGGVDLLPLANLYKYEVRAVARAIGVPENVIQRPPSAGLWDGQTDETDIGLSYDQLDSTLEAIET